MWKSGMRMDFRSGQIKVALKPRRRATRLLCSLCLSRAHRGMSDLRHWDPCCAHTYIACLPQVPQLIAPFHPPLLLPASAALSGTSSSCTGSVRCPRSQHAAITVDLRSRPLTHTRALEAHFIPSFASPSSLGAHVHHLPLAACARACALRPWQCSGALSASRTLVRERGGWRAAM